MRILLVGLFLLSGAAFGRELNARERAFAKEQVRQIDADIEKDGLHGLASRTDQALHALVYKAVSELHKKGYHSLATQAEGEWNSTFQGSLSRTVLYGYGDIGDHKPLIQWLDNFYMKLEKALGKDLCQFLRLTDIKTFNSCIPVAFHPCTFDMDAVTIDRRDEYRLHMQKGAYKGLLPVTTYWAVDIACTFSTSGIGVLFCGPIASLAEMAMLGPISGKISDKIFDRNCN